MPKNDGAPQADKEAADEPDAAAFDPDSSANVVIPTDTLIPAVQAARLFHRTTRTLRNWESRGLLPGLRIGRSLYFKLSDIERLIAGGEAFATAPQSPPTSSGDGNLPAVCGTYHDKNSGGGGAA